MIETIRQFFDRHLAPEASTEPASEDALALAAAVLMLEVTRYNDDVDPREKQAIRDALDNTFALSSQRLQELEREAERAMQDSTSLYPFTRLINERFHYQDKLRLMLALWKIAYANGYIDKHENHYLRKIAKLIYFGDDDFIVAKVKAEKSAEAYAG